MSSAQVTIDEVLLFLSLAQILACVVVAVMNPRQPRNGAKDGDPGPFDTWVRQVEGHFERRREADAYSGVERRSSASTARARRRELIAGTRF